MTPPFVTAHELLRDLTAPEGARPPVVADVRWSLDGSEGHHTYLKGHLPGAVYVDLEADLSAPASIRDGRHPLPSPERFAQALGARGIGAGERLVAYDVLGGVVAARLVWMLRVIGQDAAVLSGGLAAWPRELEKGPVVRPKVPRSPVPWPTEAIVDADDVAALAAISARVAAVGAADADDVVAYCGSGVTACFDLLALETVGVRGRLYPGSWSALAADASRPVSTGD